MNEIKNKEDIINLINDYIKTKDTCIWIARGRYNKIQVVTNVMQLGHILTSITSRIYKLNDKTEEIEIYSCGVDFYVTKFWDIFYVTELFLNLDEKYEMFYTNSHLDEFLTVEDVDKLFKFFEEEDTFKIMILGGKEDRYIECKVD